MTDANTAQMQHLIQAAGLPAPHVEHRFFSKRRWRFDLAWPDYAIALEIEGGGGYMRRPCPRCKAMISLGGRHTSPKGFAADLEKYNTAALLGWRVFRVLPEHVKSGDALGLLEGLFKMAKPA